MSHIDKQNHYLQQFLYSFKSMSQQGGSSVMSSDNPQAKYKKALKEISKLINANKVIREEAEESRRSMEEQMNQLAIRYNNLETENHQLKKQRESLEKYFQELQESHSQLQKQHHTTEKQLAYLNDMIAEQNAQLKKVQMTRDEKKITQLIRTYEEKQHQYLTERNKAEDTIHKLRDQLTDKDNQLNYQRNIKEQAEEKYAILSTEVSKYKELNAALISRNEKIYKEFYDKEGSSKEKQREIQSMLQQFKKQINSLKAVKENVNSQIGNHYETSYELLLQDKNRIIIQYAQLKDQFENAQSKIKDMYNLEEKMKAAVAKADKLNEQCNMLKSKVVVLQSRDLMDEAIDFEFNSKQFDDKVTNLLNQGDPILTIKNSDETSHFRILRGFIIELREKMEKINIQRKQYMKKYKSISAKHGVLAQDASLYEQQNKLLRGKIQGFQKLTEKLQNELEKNLVIHQEQMAKVTTMSNELINQKTLEVESVTNFLKDQMELIQDKCQKVQKNLRQQVESLKLQLTAYRINNQQLQNKNTQLTEFINIYKKKMDETKLLYQGIEEKHTYQQQILIKVQQLLKDQKSKNENLMSAKHQLSAKVNELNDQLGRKQLWYEEKIKNNNENYQIENRRLKSQNIRLKQELQICKKEINSVKREFQQKRSRDGLEIQQLRRQNTYFKDIQSHYNKQRQKNRQLQSQNQTLKLKNSKHSQQFQKISILQEQILHKNDQCNDLTRKILNIQSQLQQIQSELNQSKIQQETLRKQLSITKMKLLENTQLVRRQLDTKDQQSRSLVFKLNEEISDLSMQLNEQKTKNSRINTQYYRLKSENERYEDYCRQLKEKQAKMAEMIQNLKINLQESVQESQKVKSEYRLNQLTIKRQTDDIQNLQKRINLLIQDQSNLKIKQQSSENSKNQMIRQLESLKFYFSDIEQYINRSKNKTDIGWEEQRVRNNMGLIISKLKSILKTPDATYQSSSSGFGSTAFQQTISLGLANNQVLKNPIDSINYGNPNSYKKYIVKDNSQSPENINNFPSTVRIGRDVAYESRQGSGDYTKDFLTNYAESATYRNYP